MFVFKRIIDLYLVYVGLGIYDSFMWRMLGKIFKFKDEWMIMWIEVNHQSHLTSLSLREPCFKFLLFYIRDMAPFIMHMFWSISYFYSSFLNSCYSNSFFLAIKKLPSDPKGTEQQILFKCFSYALLDHRFE